MTDTLAPMDNLIEKLDVVNLRTELVKNDFYDSEDDEVYAITSLADDIFITQGGSPNFNAISELNAKRAEYRVGPGEKDSFGWLSGVIYLPNGKIVFG